jgi:glycosyltransferase involved in cell wall biosynthesis
MHFALAVGPTSRERVRRLVTWADVVQVNTLTPLGLRALRQARRMRVPAVLGFHHQEENLTLHLERLGRFVAPGLRAWFRLLCGLPDAVVAPTRFAAGYAGRYTQAPIHVVSNGIRLPEAGSAERERAGAMRRWLLADGGGFLLSYVGRLDPEKRPGDLLDLMAVLCPLRPDARLAVAGGGHLRSSLQGRVASLGLGEQVRFLGYVSEGDKDALLRASDVFLMPSPTELQNIATLEAMARGCAVFAAGSPTSAVPQVIGEAGCGLVYDPGDLGGAARELSRLLDDPARLGLLGERALAGARSHDVRESGRRLVALYRGLLHSRRPCSGSAPARPRNSTGGER